MDCPICDQALTELPSGDKEYEYRGCNYCYCIWVYTKGSPVYRRMEDNEILQNINGKYYLRGA